MVSPASSVGLMIEIDVFFKSEKRIKTKADRPNSQAYHKTCNRGEDGGEAT